VILRHTELTAYRCFLPDLAGFTGFCCTGPSPFFKVLSAELRYELKKKDSHAVKPNFLSPFFRTQHSDS
jgi:hypothetical protein